MTRSVWLWLLLFAGTLGGGNHLSADGNEKKGSAAAEKAADGLFERLSKLQGEWIAEKTAGHLTQGQVASHYRLTAGGTAVAETVLPGTPMEMLSVYHREGGQLVMTHYCCMGNQPKMRAKAGKDKDEVVFEFIGGANIDPEKDSYLHGGVVRFVDADHLHYEWEFYVDGKPGETYVIDLVKKKTK